MMRYVVLWVRLLSMGLAAKAVYRTDFLVGSVTFLMTQVMGLIFMGLLFFQVPVLVGWSFQELLLCYAYLGVVRGLFWTLLDSWFDLTWAVRAGALDQFLVRPVPAAMYIAMSRVRPDALLSVLVNLGLFVYCVAVLHLSWYKLTFTVLVGFPSSLVLLFSLFMAYNALILRVVDAGTGATLIYDLSDMSRYPLEIYPASVRLVLSWVVPFAYIAIFPVSTLLGRQPYAAVGWLTPVVAGVAFLLANLCWALGLRRYESTGS
jgi:ABC-2 type transport system permease protein